MSFKPLCRGGSTTHTHQPRSIGVLRADPRHHGVEAGTASPELTHIATDHSSPQALEVSMTHSRWLGLTLVICLGFAHVTRADVRSDEKTKFQLGGVLGKVAGI